MLAACHNVDETCRCCLKPRLITGIRLAALNKVLQRSPMRGTNHIRLDQGATQLLNTTPTSIEEAYSWADSSRDNHLSLAGPINGTCARHGTSGSRTSEQIAQTDAATLSKPPRG